MLERDEDALICDFAETYHIHDIYAMDCQHIATLAAGLRDDSRIKLKHSGLRISPELFALAVAADKLSTLVWFQTRDGQKGRNRPPSILKMLSEDKENKEETRSFRSGEDFMREWNRLAGKGEENAGSGESVCTDRTVRKGDQKQNRGRAKRRGRKRGNRSG